MSFRVSPIITPCPPQSQLRVQQQLSVQTHSVVFSSSAPCVPTGVLSAVDCSSNALAVSWTPFSIPVNYSVTAVDRTGGSASLSCSSVGGGGGGCVVAGLLCGQQYSVTVRAQGDPCPGPSSAAQSVRSGMNRTGVAGGRRTAQEVERVGW